MVFILLVILLATANVARTSSVWDSIPDPAPAPSDSVTLVDVLARIKQSNPTLRAVPLRGAAAAAHVAQAHARPNPSLAAVAENVAGSYSGFEQSELSLWLSQEIELGGKRSSRVDLAQRVADETARETHTQSFDVYLAAKERFAVVVHAEERARLTQAAEAIVARVARSARERVQTGGTLTADAALAEAALARVHSAIDATVAERARARSHLAALWGEPLGFETNVARSSLSTAAVPPIDSASAWARYSPAVERARLAGASSRASAVVEQSLRIPNVTVEAGARRVEADDATTWLFGVSLPLPVWDRRAGAIHAAQASAAVAELEVEQLHAAVTSELAGHIVAQRQLRDRVRRIESDLEPAVAAAAENMSTAYTIGRTSYSDLLEVQRALLELREDANDVRLAIVQEIIAIERLCGRTIEELMRNE